MKYLYSFALAIAIVLALTRAQAEETAPITDTRYGRAFGRALLEDGSYIKGSPVYLHQVEPEQIPAAAKAATDTNGLWSVNRISPGRYVVSPSTSGRWYTESEAKEIRAGELTDFGVQYVAHGHIADSPEGIAEPKHTRLTKLLSGFGKAEGTVRFKNGTARQGGVVYLTMITPSFRPGLLKLLTGANGRWSAFNVLPGQYVLTKARPFLTVSHDPSEVHEIKSGRTTEFGILLVEEPKIREKEVGRQPVALNDIQPSDNHTGEVLVTDDNRLVADIGIEVANDGFARVIKRGEKTPCDHQEVFSTATDNQRSLEIHVLQGNHTQTSKNRTVGRFTIQDIPNAPAGTPQIGVSFQVRADKSFALSAHDMKTNRPLKIAQQQN